MQSKRRVFKSEEDLQKAILQEKIKGTPDVEIGKKYGVTFRYIERLITKTQGLNVSALNVSKKIKTLYPKDFKEEQTTVWSFKQRGNWTTHDGRYCGNWSLYIPQNKTNNVLPNGYIGDINVSYNTKMGGYANMSSYMNKLYAIGCLKKEEKFNKMSLAKLNKKDKKGEVRQ